VGPITVTPAYNTLVTMLVALTVPVAVSPPQVSMPACDSDPLVIVETLRVEPVRPPDDHTPLPPATTCVADTCAPRTQSNQ
jgi:hypothetical protein